MTIPLPTFLAACSRLTRWRSTSNCFSRAVRPSIDFEMDTSFISLVSPTDGCKRSRTRCRSAFLAQPGNGNPRRFRASRTRLLITIRLLEFSVFIANLHGCFYFQLGFKRTNLIAQQSGLFVFLVFDRLFKLSLDRLEFPRE